MVDSNRSTDPQSAGDELPGASRTNPRGQDNDQHRVPNGNIPNSGRPLIPSESWPSPPNSSSRFQNGPSRGNLRGEPTSEPPRVRFAGPLGEEEYGRSYRPSTGHNSQHPSPYGNDGISEPSRNSYHSHYCAPVRDTSNLAEWGFHWRDSHGHRHNGPVPSGRPRLYEDEDEPYDPPPRHASDPRYGYQNTQDVRDPYRRRSRRSSRSNHVNLLEGLLCGMGTARPSSSGHRHHRHRSEHRRPDRRDSMYRDSQSYSRHPNWNESAPSRHAQHNGYHGTSATVPQDMRGRYSRHSNSNEQVPSRPMYDDGYHGTSRQAMPDRRRRSHSRHWDRYEESPPPPRRQWNGNEDYRCAAPPISAPTAVENVGTNRRNGNNWATLDLVEAMRLANLDGRSGGKKEADGEE